MPRYLVERDFGTMSDEEMQEVVATSTVTGREHFPDIVWERSHVCHDGGVLKSFCVYEAPSAERLYEHSSAVSADVTTHRIYEIVGDMNPSDVRT